MSRNLISTIVAGLLLPSVGSAAEPRDGRTYVAFSHLPNHTIYLTFDDCPTIKGAKFSKIRHKIKDEDTAGCWISMEGTTNLSFVWFGPVAKEVPESIPVQRFHR